MKIDSPSFEYCIRLLRRGSDAFIQFINVLIEIKPNDIVDLLLALARNSFKTAILQSKNK